MEEPELPRKILVMQALLRRLPDDHEKRKQIENDLEEAMQEYEGELRFHEVLRHLFHL